MKQKPVKWGSLIVFSLYMLNVILHVILANGYRNNWYYVSAGLWFVGSVIWGGLFLASIIERMKYNRWLAKQDKPVGMDVQVVYKHSWPVVKEQDDKN